MHRRHHHTKQGLAAVRSALRTGLCCSLLAVGCGPTGAGSSSEPYAGGAATATQAGYANPGYGGYENSGSDGTNADPVASAATAAASPGVEPASAPLRATIGANGGELSGAPGSPFENVRLSIPQGALSSDTAIEITLADESTALPQTAVRCGPMFALAPAGLALAVPASLTLPVDATAVSDQNRFDDEVKVWVSTGQTWAQRLQTTSAPGSVTVEINTFSLVAAGVNPPAQTDIVRFALHPNPKFAACLAQFPNDRSRQPEAQISVVRGDQNDSLFLRARNLRSGLAFSMFMVQNSALDAKAANDPRFRNFGVAVYQTDLDADMRGAARASVRTILLDQNFVFDDGNFGPTSTFHIGFWFNDPSEAAACGFNANKPTPFNETHDAGPMAMISVPGAHTGLGPLCTNPDISGDTPRCLLKPAP